MKWILIFAAASSFAAVPKKPLKKNENKNLAFDSQVVEGEVYRPDYSVVTGEAPGEGWGVLRLRKDFRDHAATDAAEQEAKR